MILLVMKFFFSQAKLSGVSSITGHALSIVLGEDNAPSHWLEEYEEINERISSYMNELKRLSRKSAEVNFSRDVCTQKLNKELLPIIN